MWLCKKCISLSVEGTFAMRSILACAFAVLVILSTNVDEAKGSKILLLPVPWRSVALTLGDIGEALAARGHDVHMVLPSHYPNVQEFRNKNISVLQFKAKYPDFSHMIDDYIDNLVATPDTVAWMRNCPEGMLEVCMNVMENEELHERIKAEQFDLVFVHAYPMYRCNLLLPYKLHIPYVALTTQAEPWLVRSPALPSFVPFTFHPTYTDKMTFWERLWNTILVVDWITRSNEVAMWSDELVTKYVPEKPQVSMNYLAGKSLIWFIETDPVFDYPRPLTPNEVEIAGLSTKPAKPLHLDLQQFMDAAETGVILAVFGSETILSEDQVEKLMAVFEALSPKFHIIWKYTFSLKGDQAPPKTSNNILLMDWVPQNDILAHPNTKLFMTHCGISSVYEGLYHGVPMLGLPLYYDQFLNANRLVSHGIGETKSFKESTSAEIKLLIDQMIDNPKYTENIKKASAVYRSRPDTPVERVVYWVEHVLEFGGDHLRSHALDMPWYQYLMLDVLAVVIAIVFLLFFIIYKFGRYATRKLKAFREVCVHIRHSARFQKEHSHLE